MGINIDHFKLNLESLDIDQDRKEELLREFQMVQKEVAEMELLYERLTKDKSTLYTLLNRTSEDLEKALRQLELEKERSEKLLLNILPGPIAERLKSNEDIIADIFPEVSLMFTDIVDFTPMSTQLSPSELVIMLNEVFSNMDDLTEKYELEKIKTIGDAYMVAAGLPVSRPDHARAIADMAIETRAMVNQFRRPSGEPLSVRIGIHTGPVVAGIIGKKKFIYDLWGDSVNTASRMESSGVKDEIQVTREIFNKLKEKYNFRKRGVIDVKGKGEMTTYFLIDKR